MRTNNKAFLVILFIVSLLATGCASFTGDNLPIVDKLPDKSAFKSKPSVYIDAKFFMGLLSENVALADSTQGTEKIKSVVEKVSRESTLFRSYTLDTSKAEEADYRIKMYLQNHGNKGAAMASGFISGFTLGVIPGAATDNFRLSVTVVDRSGRSVASFDLDDSVTTWVGIWFIPAMGKSPAVVVPAVWENMVKTAYQKITAVLPYASLGRRLDFQT